MSTKTFNLLHAFTLPRSCWISKNLKVVIEVNTDILIQILNIIVYIKTIKLNKNKRSIWKKLFCHPKIWKIVYLSFVYFKPKDSKSINLFINFILNSL